MIVPLFLDLKFLNLCQLMESVILIVNVVVYSMPILYFIFMPFHLEIAKEYNTIEVFFNLIAHHTWNFFVS